METYEIYLAGDFITSGQTLQVNNPYDKKPFAQTYLANHDILEQAIKKGLQAEATMAALPDYKRYNILQQISVGIHGNRSRLARVIAREAGKPMKFALGEIDRASQTFQVAAEEAKRRPAEYFSIDWTPAGEGKEGMVKHVPIGLVAGISPFNFPMNLAAHKIAPALAAGNPIILKPARSTPLSVLELAKIVAQTDLPAGGLSILPMDREAGNRLVTDERFKLLSFTGSPEVGWKMKSRAGKKKTLLEMGGNAGVIVGPSADIAHAVKRSVVGGFAYSGQVCIHAQRIYVHDDVFDQFVSAFVKEAENLKVGDPQEDATQISAMIDEKNARRVEQWIQEAREAGAKVLTGGSREGAYVAPTVLTNTNNRMKVCALEIFGPVVAIERYSEFRGAVDLINDSDYGLQAGVFTNSIQEMNEAYNHLQVGGIIINDVPTFRVDHMPYGGVKDSGLGREGLKYAIAEMSEPRLLVKNKY